MKHPQEFGNSQRKLINFLERIVGFGISISCLCLLVVNPQFQSIDPIYVQEPQWVEINFCRRIHIMNESMALQQRQNLPMKMICRSIPRKKILGNFLVNSYRKTIFKWVRRRQDFSSHGLIFQAFSTCGIKKVPFPTHG